MLVYSHLAAALNVQPTAILGHSFGGKVALTYLDQCRHQGHPPPRQVWVLDALPGTGSAPISFVSSCCWLYVHACNAGLTDYAKRDLTTSIETILPVVKKILLPIRSKTKLIEELQKSGVGLGEAQWFTTNLRLIGQSPELYEWKMDVDVIEQLFDSFLATDLWPVVESCKESTDVALHFVRAAKNTMWTRDVLDRLDALKDHHVHHHLLEQSGHWVHIDNPNGLLKIIQPYML